MNTAATLAEALEKQQEFVERLESGESDCFHLIDSTISLLKNTVDSTGASVEQRVFVSLAMARAFICKGAGERRRDDLDAAKLAYSSADEVLESSRSEAFATRSPTGIKGLLGLGNSGPNEELINDWNRTMGGLLMNWGVLDKASGDHESASDRFRLAEEYLFVHYLRNVGPGKDPEATSRTINLWQNSMEASLSIGDYQHASKMVENALKMHAYWPAHGLDTPNIVSSALGDFLAAIHNSEPETRATLMVILPTELSDLVSDMLSD